MSLKMILDNGSDKIHELRKQPEAEVVVRNILGKTYLFLGFHGEAIEHLEKALDIH